jgi:hypothetical protein
VPDPQPGWLSVPDWRDAATPVQPWAAAFRRDAVLPAASRRMVIEIASGTPYALWVDGRLIGSGPARDVPTLRWIDSWELPVRPAGTTLHLAVLAQPATGSQRYDLIAPVGLWARLVIDEAIVLVSDGSWLARPATWAATGGRLSSLPVGWQEHHDLVAAGDWTTAAPGEGWAPAFDLGPTPCPPWREVLPRPIPLLREAPAAPRLVWRGRGAPGEPPAGADPARWFNGLDLAGAPCDGADGWLDLAGGEVVTLDLGRTRLARPGFEVAPGSAVRIDCFQSSELGDRPTASLGFGSTGEGFADSVRLAGGIWQRSQPRGLRFATLRASAPCRLRPLVTTLDFPWRDDAGLVTEDGFLAALWRTSAANLASSACDVLVDTCHREHVLWTMDACASGLASWHLHGDPRLWGRCLALIARGIDADGAPQAVVPAQGPCLIDQTCWWARGLADWHLHTGDRDLPAEAAPALTRFLRLCARDLAAEGLYHPPRWSWHFVDWAEIDKRRWSLPINALLLDAADSALGLAAALGDADLAAAAAPLASALRPGIGRFLADGGAVLANLPGPDEGAVQDWARQPHTPGAPASVHALALAVRVGGPALRAAAADRLTALLGGRPRHGPTLFGPGWAALILAAAPRAVAWSHVRALYGPYLEAGCPTWPETFGDPRDQIHNSAHGWGAAVASWLVEAVVGLRPAAPGWRTVAWDPAPWFRGTYRLRLPAGEIVATVDGAGRRLALPPGTARADAPKDA